VGGDGHTHRWPLAIDHMKTMTSLLLLLLTSCTPDPEGNTESNTPSVTESVAFLDLGNKLPPDLKKEEAQLLFFSNAFHEQYALNHAGIEYRLLALPDIGTINGIVCKDHRFVTPEGVRIGQTLKEVKDLTGGKYKTMPGFGYWVPLSSGWNAVFFQGASTTDGPLASDAQVSLVAKSMQFWPAKR
jgi:hypothetical protein